MITKLIAGEHAVPRRFVEKEKDRSGINPQLFFSWQTKNGLKRSFSYVKTILRKVRGKRARIKKRKCNVVPNVGLWLDGNYIALSS